MAHVIKILGTSVPITSFTMYLLAKVNQVWCQTFQKTVIFPDQFLRTHLPETERVFKGAFTVTDGDFLPDGTPEVGSFVHIEKSMLYQHKLDLIFTGSRLAPSYLHNEVFLLEGWVQRDICLCQKLVCEKDGLISASFSVYFLLFNVSQFKLIKA